MRRQISAQPKYDVNPYTDVDVLIKTLKRISENFFFYLFEAVFYIDDFLFVTTLVNQNNLKITVTNRNKSAIVTKEILFSVENKVFDLKNRIITPDQSVDLFFPINSDKEFTLQFRGNTIILCRD